MILSHICTISVYPDKLKVSRKRLDPQPGGGKRGAVTGFSRASRKRIFSLMHELEFKTMTFITLTYPAEFPKDGKEVKKHLRRFRARIERAFGKLRVMWRLEYQRRGAPHFHLLVLDPPFIPKEWLSTAWAGSVKSKDPKHLKFGTRIEKVAQQGENGKIMAYVGKYISKPSDGEREADHGWTGRYWGKWNIEKQIPIEVELEAGQAVRVTAGTLSGWGSDPPYEPREYDRCTIFGHRMGSDEFSRTVCGVVRQVRGK